nr:MAG TPA: hypothetical protein [Bacteriophage sp.]
MIYYTSLCTNCQTQSFSTSLCILYISTIHLCVF